MARAGTGIARAARASHMLPEMKADKRAPARRRWARHRGPVLLLALGSLLGPPWSGRAAAALAPPWHAPEPVPCAAPAERQPIIEPGRDRELRGLFAPYVAGEPIDDTGLIFRAIATRGDAVDATVEGPAGELAGVLRLRALACAPDAERRSASFGLTLSGSPDAGEALERLAQAVTRNDPGGFYRATAAAPPPPPPAGTAPEDAAASSDQGEEPRPFPANQLGLAVILGLALLSLLADGRGLWRDLGLDRAGAASTLAWLLGLTVAAAALRVLAGPTFLREAYPLPNVYALTEAIQWRMPITAYPQGSALMTAALAPLLPPNPYDAWFAGNLVFGTLTVLAAYVLGVGLTGARRTGLVAAALLTFWPQHIRFSASESTHVAFVLWTTLALGLTALAARNGRARTFAAAVACAAAAVTTRPEAALCVLPLAVLALTHGPGVRRQLTRPRYLVPVFLALWLLWPIARAVLTDPSAGYFDPTAERVGARDLLPVGRLARALLIPSQGNAFFDLANTPAWLWPLALWGLFGGWRRRARGAVVALALLLVGYLALYARMAPSITVWPWGRYHMAALPAALGLATLGLDDLLRRLPGPAGRRWAVAGAAGLAALGCLLWWPAVKALPMDWQRELEWLVDLGRREPAWVGADTRVVLPDNRRRFRDLSPRAGMSALTANRQPRDASVPVAQALARLHLEGPAPAAIYVEGLFCHLALGPGEAINPQCAAMHEAFVLEPLEAITVDEPPFLTAYERVRAPAPLTLSVYRVGERTLPPDRALALLPAPWPPGADPDARVPVMGSPTDPDMRPATPPLR